MTDLATMWSSLRVQLDAHRPGFAPTRQSGVQRTPVAILTGFLGAGKSTLLARLLTRPPNGFVVRAVVNDVGSLPFDPTLVAAGSEVQIELTNGCGCCERTADLAATLEGLASDDTDLIVLEASGVADPLALAQLIEASPGLRLDRIVTVVDAGALERQRAASGLRAIIDRQLDSAHCVIVTHTDRVPADERQRVVDLVAEQAPGRVVTCSTLAEPAAEMLAPAARRGARPLPAAFALQHDLVTLTVSQRGPIGRKDLERALGRRSSCIVRGKGRLLLDDGHAHVQFTSTSTSISAADPGECGMTIVATTRSEAQALAGLLAGADR